MRSLGGCYSPSRDHAVLVTARFYSLLFSIVAPRRCWRRGAQTLANHLHNLDTKITNEAEQIKQLRQGKDDATSLDEYVTCAETLDHLEGHEAWKTRFKSVEPSYKPHQIDTQIKAIRRAVDAADREQLYLILHTCLDRQLGGMNKVRLYKHSWFGTKRLVDEYIDTVVDAIRYLVQNAIQPTTSSGDVAECRQVFHEALHYHGRTALCLSGGALLGMKHIGVVKCLWECDLLPNIVSGTSAGSIVAAIVCSSTNDEMETSLRRFPDSNLAVFDAADTTWKGWVFNRLHTFYWTGRFFDPEFLRTVMKEWLRDLTFKEAFNKTQRTLNICVSRADEAQPSLLNYITTPNVLIWSAVCASCAVPGVFPKATVYQKNPRTRETEVWIENASSEEFVDGSLDHDIPMHMLQEMFNVSFFITSQVNPHVRPFLAAEEEFKGKEPASTEPRKGFASIFRHCTREVLTRSAQISQQAGLPPALWRWAAILNQQYTGDISILPQIQLSEMAVMVANPSPEYMHKATLDGERATWPKISRVKNSVAIELALLSGIRDLNERLHFNLPHQTPREREWRGRKDHRATVQPMFLRGRSLSHERYHEHDAPDSDKEQSSLVKQRNRSLGEIEMTALFALTPSNTIPSPFLSPQAGIVDCHLTMTRLPEAY
jgi:TAG lipase / steryl ester hydrolase / phospholipase A2 / LPA acyltransferase